MPGLNESPGQVSGVACASYLNNSNANALCTVSYRSGNSGILACVPIPHVGPKIYETPTCDRSLHDDDDSM